MPNLDQTAILKRAHKALGELIATLEKPDRGYTITRHGMAWAAFYDAMRYVPAIEDAADEALADTLVDMGLDSEGYRTDDSGDTFIDSDGDWCREYVPMTAIYMPVMA